MNGERVGSPGLRHPFTVDRSLFTCHVSPYLSVMLWLYVAVGGAVGSVARYLLGPSVQGWAPGTFPVGTLAINVSGSFLIGVILQYAAESSALSAEARMLLAVGFCGGFTTFSAFSWETIRLVQGGEWAKAATYVASSVILSVLATALGIVAARHLPFGARGA